MAYISNQWLKGGKEWFPVYTKLELDNSDYADYEFTLRKEVGTYKQPIHCTDKKRLKFYVKDNNEWFKDIGNVKIDNTIRDIKLKQSKF